MQSYHLLFLAVGLLLASDDAKKVAKGEKLLGDWKLVSHETEGKVSELPMEADIKLVFEAETVSLRSDKIDGGKPPKWTYKLDLTTMPKLLDLTGIHGVDTKGQMLEGIYKIEGDELTICIQIPGAGAVKQRPSEFNTKEGTGVVLMTFQRVK